MGCVSFPIWIAIVTGTVIVTCIIIIVTINRKWNAIKHLLFFRFNILINDDEPENVEDLEFDAFVIYRQVKVIKFIVNIIVISLLGMFVYVDVY